MTTTPTKAGYITSFFVCAASSSSHFSVSVKLRSTSGSRPVSSPALTRLRNTGLNTSGLLASAPDSVWPAADPFDETRDHLAKARVLDAVAKIGQSVDERHAGRGELFEMETKIDEVRTLDVAPKAERSLSGAADDQIEPHALEAQLEIDDVQRIDLPEHRLAVVAIAL